jgi:hypothetical protein
MIQLKKWKKISRETYKPFESLSTIFEENKYHETSTSLHDIQYLNMKKKISRALIKIVTQYVAFHRNKEKQQMTYKDPNGIEREVTFIRVADDITTKSYQNSIESSNDTFKMNIRTQDNLQQKPGLHVNINSKQTYEHRELRGHEHRGLRGQRTKICLCLIYNKQLHIVSDYPTLSIVQEIESMIITKTKTDSIQNTKSSSSCLRGLL